MGIPDSILEELDGIILPWGYDRRKTLYRRRLNGNISVLHLYSPGWDPDFGGIDAHVGVLRAGSRASSGRNCRSLCRRMARIIGTAGLAI